jgi:hypothetical protein
LNGSVILSYIDFHCHDACFSPLFFEEGHRAQIA